MSLNVEGTEMETAVDLATLDALFAAATPGEWKPRTMYSLSVVDAPGGTDTYFGTVWGSIVTCEETEQTDGEGRTWSAGGTAKANAALIAALHNAWPAIRRRLEIGDAAVEVWRAEERVEQLLMTNVFNMDRYRQAELSAEIDLERLKASAARSRLRALREAQNG